MAFTAIRGSWRNDRRDRSHGPGRWVAEVGIALTVVGGVTGSSPCSRSAPPLSLVGGVGGMVAGAASGRAAAAAGESAAAGLAEVGDGRCDQRGAWSRGRPWR